MVAALAPVQVVQASTYLKGATDVTLRKRLLLGWLDKAGRINRSATGKDMNWLIKFKNATASPYTPYQNLNFSNDNYWVSASVTPEWWHTTSGMDVTEKTQNTGPSSIVNSYEDRYDELAMAMEIYTAQSLYMNYNGSGSNRMIGLGTIAVGDTTIACTNADRLRAPLDAAGTYAGLNLGLGSQGGSWSNNIGTSGVTQPMSTHLGTDWPDGQGDASNAYDGTSPRLYNENSNRWADPSATPANSTWRTNCVSMLSRANTDLRMNSMESMMPNVHVMASQRYQDVKDKMRESFRDLLEHGPSVNLGYHDTLAFEGAPLSLDYEVPANITYSLCAASMDLQFFGNIDDSQSVADAGVMDGTQQITGGIFSVFGPQRPPHMLQWVWIMLCGGNTRFSPKWVVAHKDWTY